MMFITDRLDKIASSLESKGLLRDAEEIDVVSNTLEHIAGSIKGPGIPDGTGPHGRGRGPGKGRGDGTGLRKKEKEEEEEKE